MDKNGKLSALSHMTTEQLQELNDLYMTGPKIKLPFSQAEITHEITRRGGQATREHMADLKTEIQDELLRTRRKRLTLRYVKIAIAICIGMLLCGAAYVILPTLFQFIRNESTVAVGGTGEIQGEPFYELTLDEALELYGLQELNPTWLPEQLTFQYTYINEMSDVTSILAAYEDEGGNEFTITITIMNNKGIDTYSGLIEIDGDYETIEIQGITHYLETNMDVPTIMWQYQNCIVQMGGGITEEELRQVVYSIYN